MGSLARTINRRKQQKDKTVMKELEKRYGVKPKERCPHCNQPTVFKVEERALIPKKPTADGGISLNPKLAKRKKVFICVRCGKES